MRQVWQRADKSAWVAHLELIAKLQVGVVCGGVVWGGVGRWMWRGVVIGGVFCGEDGSVVHPICAQRAHSRLCLLLSVNSGNVCRPRARPLPPHITP